MRFSAAPPEPESPGASHHDRGAMGRARLPRPILSALGLVGYAVLLGIATGCGSIDPSPDSDGSETPGASGAGNVGGAPALGSDEALLPWATGNTWTYQVTKD